MRAHGRRRNLKLRPAGQPHGKSNRSANYTNSSTARNLTLISILKPILILIIIVIFLLLLFFLLLLRLGRGEHSTCGEHALRIIIDGAKAPLHMLLACASFVKSRQGPYLLPKDIQNTTQVGIYGRIQGDQIPMDLVQPNATGGRGGGSANRTGPQMGFHAGRIGPNVPRQLLLLLRQQRDGLPYG